MLCASSLPLYYFVHQVMMLIIDMSYYEVVSVLIDIIEVIRVCQNETYI